ncbi:MAG: hypothetical protein JST80_00955 [Bdellovibrionales bacterium]|nr:hypothetical protein [Bdellovibrionales bacterium]
MYRKLLIILIFFSVSAHARVNNVLTCAYKPGQNLYQMKNGAVVESSGDFADGGRVGGLTLVTYANGKVSRMVLDTPVRWIDKAKAISDSLTPPIFKAARLSVDKIESARAITLNNDQPAPVLVNYFDKNGRFLTGALLVPVGGMQLCYPVKTEL